MKRGAEKYLTKDDDALHDEAEEASSEGPHKADDAVLATRKIRALPKRVGGSPAPSPSTNGNGITDEHPPSSPKFGGFTGFGSSSTSFTSTTSSSQSSLPLPTSARLVSSGSSFSFPSIPTVASTASNTAKTFASFIADSSSSKPAAAPPKSPQLSSEQRGDAEDSTAVKYFTSLRGLNVSFLAALSLAVEKDPFTDVTTVFDRYKSLRSTVQKEFDDRPSNSTNALPSAPNSKPSSVPTPPMFAGFGQLGSSSSSSTGPPSGFSFSLPPPASGATPDTSASPVTTTGSVANTSGTSLFNMSGTSPFGSSSTSGSNTSGTSLFNMSGTSPFGSSLTPGSNTFGNPSPSTSNVFGNDKPPSFFGNAQSSSASSSKPSPFGSFGGFGKTTGGVGSIGNPVGFGFGSPSKTPDGDGNGGSGSKSRASSDAVESRSSESKEVTPQPEGDHRDDAASVGILGNNPHDEEGEGEEQEDTVYSIKLRAFRLKKAEEPGGPGWVELGYGVLRLKKHKETEARRMLLRNSSTGKININFNLYSGLKPSQTKKAVTFVGHDDGVSQTYSVRLQSEEQAAKLKEALEKEIALVKGSAE
ncbi:hypothetical protein L208DRAFT_1390760 [Tricholoma matsutake]|nr:hypothetical protein L208DRAFT_1390760 [Tricholoma matsutake 945]